MDRTRGAERLDRIIATFRGRERFLVQTHNNPDPDSIACALALRYLVQRYTGRDAVIVFGGVVGRAENQALVRQLEIPMVPGSLVDYSAYDWSAVCDTQPGTNHTSFPEGFVPTVVIDHHSARPETSGAELAIVEPGYGATASLVGEMLLSKDLPIPTDVATALYYGIKSETQDLCRDTTPTDEAVYRALAKIADRKLVAKIETAPVPRAYYRDILSTIRAAQVYGDVVSADVGPVRVPDMVSEMADFLLRLDGARWSAVLGEYQDLLYVSLRTVDEAGDAGVVIAQMLAGIGSAGGHPSMAGGQVRLHDLSEEQRREVKNTILTRWRDLIGAGTTDGEPLTPPEAGEALEGGS